MGRTKLGILAVVGVLILLAWVWPDGDGPVTGDRVSAGVTTSPAADPPPSSDATDEPAPALDEDAPDDTAEASAPQAPSTTPGEDAPDSPPAPSPEPEPAPADELEAVAYDGPLGTRNHTGDETVALTFDDGPDPNWTPKVLDELRERGVKAMFCVIGAYAEANPQLIADIVHDGHTMCNHTWFHEFDLGKWSTEEIKANLQRTNDAIKKAAPGAEVKYFRHPGGQWTDRAISAAADLGMESLHWSVDPSDWNNTNGESYIRDHVVVKSEPGAIVLLHDGASNQKSMFGALKSILNEFERRGYALVAM